MSVDVNHSRKQVNRSGRCLRDFDGSSADTQDWEEAITAIDAVDWWRARHARPLARVNAGLRYYVGRAGAREQNVTQRLKRFDTMVDKLPAIRRWR
jgi:hypothetical protein